MLEDRQTRASITHFNIPGRKQLCADALAVRSVYYQVDTWQGAWQKAAGSRDISGTWSGPTPALIPGIQFCMPSP